MLYRPYPAQVEPSVKLSNWAVYELQDGSRHLVGYNTSTRDGRVSSPVASVSDEGCLLTRSGRAYTLVGPSGWSADGEYVWSRWCAIYHIDPKSVRLVSDEYSATPEKESEDDDPAAPDVPSVFNDDF